MLKKLYFETRLESAYAMFKKLQRAAAKQTGVAKAKRSSDIKSWLEQKDAYTIHRPVRKRFPRNPYSVNNILDVFECNLVEV